MWTIFPILFLIVLYSTTWIFQYLTKKKIKNNIEDLANSVTEVTPEEFFKIRNCKFGGKRGRYVSTEYEFAGVYIIYNQTKDKYYVGQSINVLKRVNNHFTGHGNGDVYADYQYGDSFTIKMIDLNKSGYSTLNELERNTIMAYDAFSKGYNKTRGNRG